MVSSIDGNRCGPYVRFRESKKRTRWSLHLNNLRCGARLHWHVAVYGFCDFGLRRQGQGRTLSADKVSKKVMEHGHEGLVQGDFSAEVLMPRLVVAKV